MTKPTSFAADIRPLFTDRDIHAMSKAFNLGSYDDVKVHAAVIYDRIRGIGGAVMPPPPPLGEGPWAQSRIDLFAKWIADGSSYRSSSRRNASHGARVRPDRKLEQVARVILAALDQKVSAFGFTVPLLHLLLFLRAFQKEGFRRMRVTSADRARLCRFVSSSDGRF